MSYQWVFIVVDVGSTSNKESIITILVFKQEVTTLGRCVDRIMFRLNKFREIKHNQLVVVIVGFLLIDEDKEVDVFLAVQEFFRWQCNRYISITTCFLTSLDNIASIFLVTVHVKLKLLDIAKLHAHERVVALHDKDLVVVFNKNSTTSLVLNDVSHLILCLSNKEVVPSYRFLRDLIIALVVLLFFTSLFVIYTEQE